MTTSVRRLSSDLLATLPAWVVARLLVGVSWVVARLVSDELAGAGPDRIGRGLMAWDADWYRSLVVGGYDALPLEGVRFFPGFILLGRLADALLPGGPTTAMVVVANLGSLLAGRGRGDGEGSQKDRPQCEAPSYIRFNNGLQSRWT